MPPILTHILRTLAVTLVSVVSAIVVAEINERMNGQTYSSYDDLP